MNYAKIDLARDPDNMTRAQLYLVQSLLLQEIPYAGDSREVLQEYLARVEEAMEVHA